MEKSNNILRQSINNKLNLIDVSKLSQLERASFRGNPGDCIKVSQTQLDNILAESNKLSKEIGIK